MYGRFSIIGGHVPGLPPKSTPMNSYSLCFSMSQSMIYMYAPVKQLSIGKVHCLLF